MAQIAAKAGLRPDQAAHRLRYGLGVAHGIGHEIGEDGIVKLVLPAGKQAAELIGGGRPVPPAVPLTKAEVARYNADYLGPARARGKKAASSEARADPGN